MTEIKLEFTNCKTNQGYVATFLGPNAEDNALAQIDRRGSTHAVSEVGPLPEDATRLYDVLYPQCHHGMSLWLCADPVSHYPRDV